jgi:hypothetical protein
MLDPGNLSESPQQRRERILAACVDACEREGREALERFCAEHPDLAEEMRGAVRAALELRAASSEGEGTPEGIPRPGATIGEFRLKERLGGGGMGVLLPVGVTLEGTPAGLVGFVSPTILTCSTPSSSPGLADVKVTTGLGTDTLSDGFIFTPAVTASPTVVPGGSLLLRNVGPAGGFFQCFFSTGTAFIPLPPFGTVFLDLAFLIPVRGSGYPTATNGVDSFSIGIPNDPGLIGFVAHFQSAAILPGAPPTLALTNLASGLIIP